MWGNVIIKMISCIWTIVNDGFNSRSLHSNCLIVNEYLYVATLPLSGVLGLAISKPWFTSCILLWCAIEVIRSDFFCVWWLYYLDAVSFIYLLATDSSKVYLHFIVTSGTAPSCFHQHLLSATSRASVCATSRFRRWGVGWGGCNGGGFFSDGQQQANNEMQ